MRGWRRVQAREYRQNARSIYIKDVLEAFGRRHIIIGHYAVDMDGMTGKANPESQFDAVP